MTTRNPSSRGPVTPPPAARRQLFLLVAVGAFIVLGYSYKESCVRAGKDFEQCWEKGLAIGGIGPGGPISAGTIAGLAFGQINKEREKREAYEKGLWTYNAYLERPTSDDSHPTP
jgi:hypothetical protein